MTKETYGGRWRRKRKTKRRRRRGGGGGGGGFRNTLAGCAENLRKGSLL
jgi:hypothetical protein